ncbi:hypothetical protein C8F04DRAFT_1155496 [Mycena alexandri]|uniref:Rhodopsin domain-containing protein n=1 Tax=Mycena alexandri TaxID=1745969 RepID=A0AAD6RY96_9AGAR|nr:hypothetical protein C8F04DRAFT_1155496 [Mycena alexandri]
MTATIPELQVVLCVLLPSAMVVTYFRLFDRYRRGKLWWDDFWAFVCTLCAIFFITVTLLHIQSPSPLKENVQVIVFYMCGGSFYAVIWTARLSILFTIIRLSYGRMRRLLCRLAMAFFVTCVILIAQVLWTCQVEPGWKDIPAPHCDLGLKIAIAQLISDVLSDVILIAAPMHLVWRVQLQRGLKLRLRAVFAATSTSTAVSLYHAYCVLRFPGLPEFLAATIQLSVTLFVANLSVIVAIMFRLKAENETDNIAPPSVVTIGAVRGRKKFAATTFGGTTMMGGTTMLDTTKVDVHIVHEHDGWNESTPTGIGNGGTNEFDENDGPDRLELKA